MLLGTTSSNVSGCRRPTGLSSSRLTVLSSSNRPSEVLSSIEPFIVPGELSVSSSTSCECGQPSFPYADLVSEFEHIFHSGQPNYLLCRRPVQSGLNISAWRELLQGYHDDKLCDMLEFGFPLDVQGEVPVNSVFRAHKGARDYPRHVETYLSSETSLGRMAGPFESNPLSANLHVSPMNTVPKDEADERRTIVDLSWPLGASVNDAISKDSYLGEPVTLRYTTIEDVCDLVREFGPGCLIYKRDLRKAYRQIPVDPRDYRFLGYYWEGRTYFDTVLVMGQRNAAHSCQRSTDGVMYIHKKRGHKGKSYLDDMIGVSLPGDGQMAYVALGDLLMTLGLEENVPKACSPSTHQTVLGVLFDTVNMTISVTPVRVVEIKDLLTMWKNKKSFSKADIRSLLGKLCSIIKCVRQSRVFINRLLGELRAFTTEKHSLVSEDLKKDVRWWFLFMEKYNGVSIIPPIEWMAPDVIFTTDSTLTGCGGLTDSEYFHSTFPVDIMNQSYSINALEILAVTIAVRLWGSQFEGQKILIYCDNMQAVTAINTGKTRDSCIGSCVRQLWLETALHGFQLKAVHLPGVENRLADSLSRWHLSPYYSLSFLQATEGLSLTERVVTESLFYLDEQL